MDRESTSFKFWPIKYEFDCKISESDVKQISDFIDFIHSFKDKKNLKKYIIQEFDKSLPSQR